MAALDSLKIEEAVAIVAPTATAHNALVALIENMVGSGGVKVTVSEGRILIELSGTNLPKSSSSSGATYTNYTFTACVSGVPKTFVIPIVSGPT